MSRVRKPLTVRPKLEAKVPSTAMVMAAISAALQMTEPMALP